MNNLCNFQVTQFIYNIFFEILTSAILNMSWRGVLAVVLFVLSCSGDAQDRKYGILQWPENGAVISNLECKKQMDLLHDHLEKQIPWAYKSKNLFFYSTTIALFGNIVTLFYY